MVTKRGCHVRQGPIDATERVRSRSLCSTQHVVRDGLLVRAPVVDAVLHGEPTERSLRTAQRHFVRTTGLTHGAVRRIERARYATTLLQQGVAILDTVHEAGYFDQPHLTRSLKQYIGQTPAQIIGRSKAEQLSLLYKTAPLH